MHNEEKISFLQKKYINCDACPLACLGRSKVVFGQGATPAQIMIIGEAPGAEEDTTGRPFVGRAGQLLRTLLQEIIPTNYSIFISNVVNCRPPQNRKPTKQESKICAHLLLHKEIEIVKPRLIIAAGSTALLTLVPQAPAILKARLNLFLYQEIPLVPALHPSFCLRFPTMQNELKKDLLFALLTLKNMEK
jgi:DNA polymerase